MTTLTSRTAFAHHAAAANRGVTVSDRGGLGVAVVMARKGKQAALAQCVRERCHIELPQGPHRAARGGLAVIGIAPATWLATSEQHGNALTTHLREMVVDLASVVDQSDAYGILRLTGPHVRGTLGKMLPVDLHPRAFKPGDVAVTGAGHVPVTLWRLENSLEDMPTFEAAVFRSMAADFARFLSESAAEFG